MTELDRRAALKAIGTALGGAAGVGALTACAPMDGDPGRVADRSQPPAEGGIGGTGIVGVLTDFGSLLINDLRIALDERTSITTAFGAVGEDALALGQSLTVEAATTPAGLLARRVHVAHPVIGPATAISTDGRAARVAGVPVTMEPGALGGFAGEGAVVAVSGVWRGDGVVASRIDPAPGRGAALAGAVVRRGGTHFVGGLPLVPPAGVAPPPDGAYVTATGHAGAAGFMARALTVGRFVGAAGPLGALSVEGFLTPAAAAPFFAVAGLGHSFAPASRLDGFSDGRTLFSGAYDGLFAVETGLPLPQDLMRRRELLRRVREGGAGDLKRPAR